MTPPIGIEARFCHWCKRPLPVINPGLVVRSEDVVCAKCAARLPPP